MIERNHLPLEVCTEDLYGDNNVQCSLQSKAAEPNAMFNVQLLSIQTYYESMWIARGLNIKYMKWQLPRNGALTEPDVEIELDDYRSYHRSKRSSLDKAK